MLHFVRTDFPFIIYNQDGDLVHHTPKPPDATNWTLPLQSPCVHANAVLSLPSDKKYIRFMSALFGSPVLSTLNRIIYTCLCCPALHSHYSASIRLNQSPQLWDISIVVVRVWTLPLQCPLYQPLLLAQGTAVGTMFLIKRC